MLFACLYCFHRLMIETREISKCQVSSNFEIDIVTDIFSAFKRIFLCCIMEKTNIIIFSTSS